MMMRAVSIGELGGPEVLKIVETPIPQPGPGQLLVKAEAIGVGKYDMLVRTGRYPFPVDLPATPGIEMSGTVEAVGSDVGDVAIGEKVYGLTAKRGCYAEYAVFDRGDVTVIGDRMPLDEAVTLGSYINAWSFLNIAAYPANVRYACMYGAAGGIGTAVCQLCRDMGIELIAVVGSAEKAVFALQQGASHAIDRSAEDVPVRIREITQGRGLDLLFDQLVGPDFRDNIQLMAPLGQIVTLNALAGLPSSDLFADLRANMTKSISVRAFSAHVFQHFPGRQREIADRIIDMCSAGCLRPAITQRFALADVVKAHEVLDAGRILGRMILTP